MKSITVFGIVFSGLIISPFASADPGQEVATYGRLDALRSQNAILGEQVKQVDLKNKLNISNPVIPIGPTNGNLGGAVSKSRSKQTSNFIDYAARVQLVSGVGGNMSATISLSTGGTAIARVGSKVQNLGIVKSITTNEVIVSADKETYSVPFVPESANNYNSSGYPASQSPYQLPGASTTVPGVIPLGSN